MKRLLFLLFYIVGSTLWAQQEDVKFGRITSKDGLSHNIVTSVIQDGRGFMWFATLDGLNRYDGYNFIRYKPNPFDSISLTNNRITALVYDPRGLIWVGTSAGLNIYNIEKNTFTSLASISGTSLSASKLYVQTLCRDSIGYIWVGTRDGGLTRISINNNDLQSIQIEHFWHSGKNENSLSSNNITAVIQDASGYLWIGTDKGLNVYNPRTQKITRILNGKKYGEKLSNSYITSLCEDFKGDVWVGTLRGLQRVMVDESDAKKLGFKTQLFFAVGKKTNSISNNVIRSIFEDSDGVLWIGTENGLNVLDLHATAANDTIFSFKKYFSDPLKDHSLSHNRINKITQDEAGIIWVATDRGLSKYDKLKQNLQYFSMEQYWDNTTHSINVWAFCEDAQGISWIGTEKGLSRIDRKKSRSFKVQGADGYQIYSLCYDAKQRVLAGTERGLYYAHKINDSIFILKPFTLPKIKNFTDPIYSILSDSKGNLWLGGKEGLMVVNATETEATYYSYNVNNFKGISKGTVNCIFEDSNHRIWLGMNGGGLLKVLNNETLNKLQFQKISHEKSVAHSLNNDVVLCIEEFPAGYLWLGTYGGGLNRYDIASGKTTYFTEQEGLSNNVVYGVLKDKTSMQLWVSTNKGLSRFDPSTRKFRTFSEEDGLQSNEFNKGAYYQSKNGEFYFGGINGFNAFYPSEVKLNKVPPRIALIGLLLSNKLIEPGPGSLISKDISTLELIEIPYVDNAITLRFTGMHYTSPENNRYKYMLEGFVEEWQDIGNKREVSFTNLDPGVYVFKVKAMNSDGVESTHAATLKIIINPPFWMTWWFRAFAIAVILAIVLGVYYSRVAIIKTQKRVLEYKVQQRTEEVVQKRAEIEEQKEKLEIEKNKTEQLLLNILPAETAKELLTTGRAAPRHYRMVTVMFADFKGFTQIAERLRPAELVAELDKAFNAFDDIAEKHNIEKIKTSGDAYMAAGGVPIRNKTNPVDCILAAMRMQAFMQDARMKAPADAPIWELRIGLHTGEIIAGVVGKKKFAYDIWGDTVNTASRMESASMPGQINISGTTYNMVSDYFDCEYRGKIPVKNKGEIDMYFVKGIKAELSKDRLGLVPNIAFQELHHFNVYSKLNYNKVKQFVLAKLEKELPENLYYHGPHHTRDVLQAAERIGKAEGLDPEELMLVKMAALLHDAGFLNKYWSNEPEGVKFAREILPGYGFTDSQIDIIDGMIMATRIPQNPTNHLEEILCDADLDYLGREDFEKISSTLQQELLDYGGIKSADDWDPIQVKFLSAHKYFTKTAKETRDNQKNAYLEAIKKRVEQK